MNAIGIHLPSEFARRLFEVSPKGMTVVIADQQNAPSEVVHPAALAPVDARKGKVVKVPRLNAAEEFRWQPDKSAVGPLSIVMSGTDRRVLVYRTASRLDAQSLSLISPGVHLAPMPSSCRKARV